MKTCPFCAAQYSGNTDCCGKNACLDKLIDSIPTRTKVTPAIVPTVQKAKRSGSTIGDGVRFGFGLVIVVIVVVVVVCVFGFFI